MEDDGVSDQMWNLYPYILNVCVGTNLDKESFWVQEYINYVTAPIRVYIARDPKGLLKLVDYNSHQKYKTRLTLTLRFIKRCLDINRTSGSEDYLDGIAVVSIIISLFENMPQGSMDAELVDLLNALLVEICHQLEIPEPQKTFTSMIFQGFAMAFVYNPSATFKWLIERD